MSSNYKETVLKQLDINNTEEVLKNLKEIQNKILKNLELQENKDVYNLLISEYTKIQKAGELIYAYKKLKANGNTNDAEMTLREAKKELMQIDTYILKWETEQNACKKCQALDGNEYHIYDDIPPKPHPNCKCKVKIVKNEISENEDKSFVEGWLTDKDIKGYIAGKMTPESKEIMDNTISKAERIFPEASALWQLSTSKFEEGQEYLSENGILLNSVDEISNKKLNEFIHKKVKSQYDADDSRGIVLNEQSTLAEKIVTSGAIRRFIVQNKGKLKPDTMLPNNTLKFFWDDIDLFGAIHRADIIDIKIDKDGTFTAKIVDTYDFNQNDKNPLVQAGYYQQKNKRIENYFVIVLISISYITWNNFSLQPVDFFFIK